jgi:nucleoid-associated protein YgaU
VAELTAANDKLTTDNKALKAQLDDLNGQVDTLRAGSSQLAAAQRDLAGLRDENARLNDALQASERDRNARIAQLQQDNAAISARLRQAQGTLDQIASAARIISGGSATGFAAAGTPPAAGPSSSPAAPADAPARIHVVAEGDSLTRISLRYYGTPNRWQDIYNANRDVLKGENALRPGQQLKIP